MQENQGQSLGWEDPLEKEMASHSSILTRGIPWTEGHDGVQSMGSQRVGQDGATKTHTSTVQCAGQINPRVPLDQQRMMSAPKMFKTNGFKQLNSTLKILSWEKKISQTFKKS